MPTPSPALRKRCKASSTPSLTCAPAAPTAARCWPACCSASGWRARAKRPGAWRTSDWRLRYEPARISPHGPPGEPRRRGRPGGCHRRRPRRRAPSPAADQRTRQPASPRAMGQSHIHESARAQVAGAAHYIDDLPEVKGTLYAAPILSTVAHGTLNSVDASAALALPGVRGVVLSSDVPGDKLLAAFAHDEPVFAVDTVQHIGQVIGLVVADSVMQARRAVRAVKLDIAPLPAVLSVHEAVKAESYVLPPVFVRRGDAATGLAQSAHRLQGAFEVGGQEHFYLEGQIAYALPLEQKQWWVYSSTKHPG